MTGQAGMNISRRGVRWWRLGIAAIVLAGAILMGAPADQAVAAPAGPAARAGASMAYDKASNGLVLFGGESAAGMQNDTWIFEGTRWRRTRPAASPTPRRWASLAADPAGRGLILFGGLSGSTTLGDTWRWENGTWTRLAPMLSPSARYGASMATDAAHAKTILFGGTTGAADGDQQDTWSWDGTGWLPTPAAGPTARRFGTATYASAAGGIVMFGGTSGDTLLNDTWLWDGLAWVDQVGPGGLQYAPGPRTLAALAAFDGGPAVLATGVEQQSDGTQAIGGSLTSLFEPDPYAGFNRWTALLSPVTPARADAVMAALPTTKQIIIFGGAGETGLLGDTLAWSGASWSAIA